MSVASRESRIWAQGRQWRILRPASLDDLWNAMGPEDFADERIPYWTEIWPASLGLADWLGTCKLQGLRCLDLGCGLGLTAMAGAARGARVTACDYEPDALRAARQNALLNDSPPIAWVAMDWRAPCFRAAAFDRIWASDIIYEKRQMRPVLALLASLLAPRGRIWLAEPGRAIFQGFIDQAKEAGFNMTCVHENLVPDPALDDRKILAGIWEIQPAAEKQWAN